MAINLFSGGYLPLEQRCLAENLFWAICRKLRRLVQQMEYVPEELQGLDAMLADTYFCNFSLFQSMPDSWAIKQLFPVMPIHRLDKPPTHARRAGRHHLRLGRQDRPVHRPPRREAHAAAARVQRRALLPGRVPGRRLPGDPRRPAQPVRRHQRRARQPGRPRQRRPRRAHQGRHRAAGARLRRVRRELAASASSAPTPRRPCARAGSPSRSRATCSSSTRTASRATPTSKGISKAQV